MKKRKNIDGCVSDIQSPLDATIHWCLIFSQPLSQISIEDDTSCTLQGLVLWQNLRTFLGEHYLGLDDQAMVRELTGDESPVVQSGISCTIGALRKGQINARLTLEFSPENDTQNILRDVSWHDIVEMPLKPFLWAIKRKIRDKIMKDTDIVSLAGFAKESGYIGQRSLKYKVALAAACGVPFNENPPDQLHNHLVREIINKKEYIRHGSIARVSLYNGVGEVVSSRMVIV